MTNPIRISTFSRFTARLIVLVFFAALLPTAWAQATAPSLGTAKSFAVLGSTTVTNTGPSTIHGDLGVSPGSAVTGFPPGLVLAPGTIHAADTVASNARAALTAAYINLAGQASTSVQGSAELGGLTLVQGVYTFNSAHPAAQVTGTLTLDAQGNANAVFIFQIASTLTTASNSNVLLINGAQPCNVFWQVGSSATLGTNTAFVGNILALTSIALQTGTSVNGRALARNGAVTLDTNNVFFSSCTTGTTSGGDTGDIPGAGPGSGGTPGTPPVNAPPVVCTDLTPPTITMTGVGIVSGNTAAFFAVQDAESGIGSILPTIQNNVTTFIPAFTPGASSVVGIYARKISNSNRSTIGLQATDLCGNVTVFDPELLTLTATRGESEPVTITGIPAEEHFVVVLNGSPGLNELSIIVNGREFESGHLRDGQSGTVDIGRAMKPGSRNTITFEFRGKAGASAGVVVRP